MGEASSAQLCFGALRAMLLAHVPPLEPSRDVADALELFTPRADSTGKKLRFAELRLAGREVHLQLMMIARSKSPAGLFSAALDARQRGPQLYVYEAPDAALFEDTARLLAECVHICGLRKLL